MDYDSIVSPIGEFFGVTPRSVAADLLSDPTLLPGDRKANFFHRLMGITPEELRESLPIVQRELGQEKGRRAFEQGTFARTPNVTLLDKDGQVKTFTELSRQSAEEIERRRALEEGKQTKSYEQAEQLNNAQIQRFQNEPELRRLEREQSNLHDLNLLDRQTAQQNALIQGNNQLAMQYAQMMNENNNRRYQQERKDAMLLLALQGLDGLFSSFG